MTPGSQIVCWGLAAALAVAPLPFGTVYPVPMAALQVGLLGLALFWITRRGKAGLSPLPWNDPLLIAGGMLAAYGLLQIVPLPAGLVSFLSPHTASMLATYSVEPSGWASLSLHPYATWDACLTIVCWTLAAVMVRHNATDLKGRLTVAGGLVAGGLFQAGYGLFEFISGRQNIFGYKKEFFTDVATGTFISRNNYAGYLEMAVPMALALALLSLGRTETGRRARLSLKQRLAAASGRDSFRSFLLLMGAFLMVTALLMSRSRMGIFSIAFALVVGGVVLGVRGRMRRFAAASVAVAVLATGFASQIDILPVVNRFRALRGEFAGGYGRLRVWKQAMPMLAAYPLFGSGMGTWEAAFSPFRDDAKQVRVDFAHNDYLEFAAESGLAGILVLAAGALLVLRRRSPRSDTALPQDEVALAAALGLVAIGLHGFTDFHLSIPADAFTVVVLIGLLARRPGPARAFAASPAAPRAAGRRPGRLASWTLCAAALAVLALAVASPAAAHVRSRTAGVEPVDLDDVDAGRPDDSAAAPGDALCPGCMLEPFSAQRLVEAASRARRRLLSDVAVLVKARTGGRPLDLAARRYLSDRIERALGLARRAIRLAPIDARAHLEAGLLEFGRFALVGLPPGASDDFDRALDEFGKSLALEPWRAGPHRKVSRILLPMRDLCEQRQKAFIDRVARRALAIDPAATDIREALERTGS